MEQDFHGSQAQYVPMRVISDFASAARFRTAYDEVRDAFRHRVRMDKVLALDRQWEQF